MFVVSIHGAKVEVESDKLTNDIDLGELASKRDAQSQAALYQYLTDQRAEITADRQRQNAAFDEQQKQVYARKVTAAQTHDSALNRGAYNEKRSLVYRHPYIYYYP
jgi:hypothetical protein